MIAYPCVRMMNANRVRAIVPVWLAHAFVHVSYDTCRCGGRYCDAKQLSGAAGGGTDR